MSIHEEEVLGKAYDARLMRRLLGYLRPHRLAVMGALASIVGHAALQLAQPYLMKVAIDRHIVTGDLTGLGALGLLFLGVLVGSFALEYAETYTMQLTGQRIMFDLRMQISRHLHRLELGFYDRNPVGRLMTRVTTDVDALNDLFSSGVVSVFGDLFTLTGIMIVLLLMDWRLALVAFSVLPLIVMVTQWFRRNARESYRKVRIRLARINAFLQEQITGMATVQLFRREAKNFDRFAGINHEYRGANIESIFYYAVFYPVIEVVGALATALILWYGGGWTLDSTLTLGSLVAFLLYASGSSGRSAICLRSSTCCSPRWPRRNASSACSTPRSRSRAPASPTPRPAKAPGRIVFDHVWAAYRGEEYVLRDVSFDVMPGQRIGIVGATGAGKSTLISLLLRFYDVNRGRILIDGVDIREMELRELRSLFGLVLQDVYLFSGTIAENVRLGHRGISEADIQRATAAVHADRFINDLPDGLNSAVAERGATLSVGQKQLLSFARALAFAPPVLVLDEATSSVDTETELLIQDALHRLMAGRTTIAIAHRLSTVQGMDKILVLHKGRLREVGSHQELLARRGIYYKLYQLQYREQEVASSGDATAVVG